MSSASADDRFAVRFARPRSFVASRSMTGLSARTTEGILDAHPAAWNGAAGPVREGRITAPYVVIDS